MFVERIPPSGMYRTATDPECIEQRPNWSIRNKLRLRVAIEGKIRRSTWVIGDRETNPMDLGACELRDKVTVDKRRATIKRRQSVEKRLTFIRR